MYPKDLMMFAEGDAPAPAPAPTPESTEPEPGTAPVEPEPGTVPAEPALEPEDLHKQKIDALQNSLDAALEELGKGNEPSPIEPAPEEPAKPVETPAPTPAPAPETPKGGDEAWRSEIEAIRQGQESFQSTTLKELESMKLKDEMIGLTSEVQAAITQYPSADADRILLEIESGSEKTVAQIAADLHTNYQTLVDKISKEQEEKIRTALEIENEGKIKVPQSSGSSSTPTGTPDIPGGPVQTKASQDAAWAQATREAKANIQ